MHILHVCPYDMALPGGVRTHILELARSLVLRGHRVTVVGFASSSRSDDATQAGLPPFREDFPGIGWFPVARSRRLPLWGTTIDVIRASASEMVLLRTFIGAEDVEIAHFHTPWTPLLSWQIVHLVGTLGLKRVATFHDTPPDTAFGRLLGNYVMPAAARFILPVFDAVISVSAVQRQCIARWSTKPIQVIPNGVRVSHFTTQQPRESPQPETTQQPRESPQPETTQQPHPRDQVRNILFIGRHEPRKGLLHLLEVYRQLQSHDATVTWSITIAGSGEETSKAVEFVKTHRLPRVTFTGFVSETEKQNLLQSCTVYVSPALYGESFGIVLLEAMALGVPVCGFGNPGYLTIANDYAPENFPSPGDIRALQAAIVRTAGDPIWREELVRRGLELASRYDWEHISDAIIDLYRNARTCENG